MRINRFSYHFIKIFFPWIVLILWAPVYGAGLTPLIVNALKLDPRILSAKAEIRASQAEVDGTYAAYYPVITGSGLYGRVKNDEPSQNDGDKRTYGLQIEQPLPFFGRESASIDISKAEVRLKQIELKRLRQSVFFEVLETAITLRAQLLSLRLRELMVDNLFSKVRFLKDSVAGGEAKMNEYYLAQSDSIQMQVLEAQAQTEHITTLEKLRSLAQGATVEPEFMAADLSTLGLSVIPADFDLALSDSLSKSPLLLLAGYDLKKAQAELAFAKVSIWPELSLNYSLERGTFGDESADTNSVSLNLNVPLFEGGSSMAKIATMRHRVEAKREKLDQQNRLHHQELQEVWSRWKSAIRMVLMLQTANEQGQQIVDAIQVQLASGANTVLVELSARLAVIETQLQEINEKKQRDLALVTLLQQMGYLVLPNNLGSVAD